MNLILATVLFYLASVNCLSFPPPQKICPKQDGGWGDWLIWSPCSKSCGTGGYQVRHRFCNNPIPKHGGEKCTGPSLQNRKCYNGPCPPKGKLGEFEYGECSKSCDGGVRTKQRKCLPPHPFTHECYEDCDGDREITQEACNTHSCTTPPPDVGTECERCMLQAPAGSVGHACRTTKQACDGRNGGIKDMYAQKGWFFLHCSPDGPWCKPCATRTLKYNPHCGQCEGTRAKGYCTGPQTWRNKMDALDLDDEIW